MIAAHYFGVDSRGFDRSPQCSRHQKIVDSPPDIAGPGVREVTPPRVVTISLSEQPERIDESGIHQILKSLAFLIGKPLLAAIRLGIRKIELGMRYIQVAAKN